MNICKPNDLSFPSRILRRERCEFIFPALSVSIALGMLLY